MSRVTDTLDIDFEMAGRKYCFEAEVYSEGYEDASYDGTRFFGADLELDSLLPVDAEEEAALPPEGTPERKKLIDRAMLASAQMFAGTDYPEEMNIKIELADNFVILPVEGK